MSLWGKIAKIGGLVGAGVAAPFTGGASLSAIPMIIGAGGSAISGATQAAAQNRGAQIEAAIEQQKLRDKERTDYENAVIDRQKADMASGEDALRKLQQTEYLLNKQGFTAPTFHSQVAGRDFTSPTFGFEPKVASDYEKWGATGLRDEVMKRLLNVDRPDNPYAQQAIAPPTNFTIDPRLLKQSIWEKIGNIAGPAMAAYGTIASNPNKK